MASCFSAVCIILWNDIAEILETINRKVGYENTVVFITADHGVVSEPSELIERNIPAGYFDQQVMMSELSEYLLNLYSSSILKNDTTNFIINYSNNNLFLNHKYIANNLDISIEEIQSETEKRHDLAFGDSPLLRNDLDIGGDLSFRLRGEEHVWTPETIGALQHAVRSADYKTFKKCCVKLYTKCVAIQKCYWKMER